MSDDFIWKRLKTIDFADGDECADDWVEAVPALRKAKPQISNIVWRSSLDNPEKWEPNVACPFNPPLPPIFVESLAGLAGHIRVLSIGALQTRPVPPIAELIQHLNPKIVEEISIDEPVLNFELFSASLRNHGAWPRLRKLRLNITIAKVTRLLNAIASSCNALRQIYLSESVIMPFLDPWEYFRTTEVTDDDVSETARLNAFQRIIHANKSTLEVLGVHWKLADNLFGLSHLLNNPDRWGQIPSHIQQISGLPYDKFRLDGPTLWGGALRRVSYIPYQPVEWQPQMEAFFELCHPTRTLESLCDLAFVAAAPNFKFDERAVSWYLQHLHRWGQHFAAKPPIERVTMEGWGWFRNALGHVFHWPASANHISRFCPLLALCPSVLDTITIRNTSRDKWSAYAVKSILSDVNWWKETGADFNRSENWGLHPIHYLVRDGDAVLCAINSPFLEWSLHSDQRHFFLSLLQFRLRCELGAASFAKALDITYKKMLELNLKPITEPLTDLQSASLTVCAPLHQSLPQLTSDPKVLLASALSFTPSDFSVAMTGLLGTNKLCSGLLEAAATAFWRPVTTGRGVACVGARPTQDMWTNYLKQLVDVFPVIPAFVFAFAMSKPFFNARTTHAAVQQLLKELNIVVERRNDSLFL